MKRLITLLMICFPAILMSQYCLKGTVLKEGSEVPLSDAVVYIPENGLLTYSNDKGQFEFCNLPAATYTLQVRLFGYKPAIERVELNDSVATVIFELLQTTTDYPEVLVYADRVERPEESPNNISTISQEQMRDDGAMTLSDGIAKIAGVQQLSTGIGISKPVIRGLFGNRIQTVFMGIRFDNQQWQDEHGLGLSDSGVDRVEVIKGPASLLYGPEAMGGVINILEDKPAPVGKVSWNISSRYFSNTTGAALDVTAKGAKEKWYWRLCAGGNTHADYSDGKNNRVLNSRYGGYSAKGTLGFRLKKWSSVNNYMFSNNNFGFIMEGLTSFLSPDARQSRTFQMPHHSVYLHVFSSQNTFRLKQSLLKWNIGVQYNDRQEQEGGNKISLDMLLNTYSSTLLWSKKLSDHLEWSLGSQELFQMNTNLGSRIIVPDATVFESSAYTYLKYRAKIIQTEAGLRYGVKQITTKPTGTLNMFNDNPGTDLIVPFSNWYQALSGALGVSLYDIKFWQLKLNVSSGYRPGNLAELSSNGIHEGSTRYELGDINLKTEQNLCLDLTAGFNAGFLSISASGYLNRFFNYIYLQPTADEYIGFQIFQYVQKNAMIKGAEVQLGIHPQQLKWVSLNSSYSIVEGTTDGGDYLPFIPAQEINTSLKFHLQKEAKPIRGFIKISADYFFAQNHPGQFETATADYALLNTGVGATWNKNRKTIHLSITCNNLLNRLYYAHLSRYKYFGIYNAGRNIAVQLNINF